MIKIYTDGSCLGNPGNGGWAAIILNELKGKKLKIIRSKEVKKIRQIIKVELLAPIENCKQKKFTK